MWLSQKDLVVNLEHAKEIRITDRGIVVDGRYDFFADDPNELMKSVLNRMARGFLFFELEPVEVKEPV
jgi:hypothetical protein